MNREVTPSWWLTTRTSRPTQRLLEAPSLYMEAHPLMHKLGTHLPRRHPR